MEHIYHERQEGYLCALHCLNNLLQNKYFTELDLAQIATSIDQQERDQMAEGGNSEEYQKFLNSQSSNMDDSGYFSIEVIIKALKVWNLELIRFNSKHEEAIKAQQDPTTQTAYICNFKNHWLTIRRIGQQYFNLNSLLSSPQLLSNSYIHLYLTQLQTEGYSIFIILGTLPQCKGDEILKHKLIEQKTSSERAPLKLKLKLPSETDDVEDDCLKLAIQESLHADDDEDKNLQQAIKLSMEQPSTSQTSNLTADEQEDLENLEKAIKLSMQ